MHMTMTIIVLVDMCKHETKGTFDHINEQDKAKIMGTSTFVPGRPET